MGEYMTCTLCAGFGEIDDTSNKIPTGGSYYRYGKRICPSCGGSGKVENPSYTPPRTQSPQPSPKAKAPKPSRKSGSGNSSGGVIAVVIIIFLIIIFSGGEDDSSVSRTVEGTSQAPVTASPKPSNQSPTNEQKAVNQQALSQPQSRSTSSSSATIEPQKKLHRAYSEVGEKRSPQDEINLFMLLFSEIIAEGPKALSKYPSHTEYTNKLKSYLDALDQLDFSRIPDRFRELWQNFYRETKEEYDFLTTNYDGPRNNFTMRNRSMRWFARSMPYYIEAMEIYGVEGVDLSPMYEALENAKEY